MDGPLRQLSLMMLLVLVEAVSASAPPSSSASASAATAGGRTVDFAMPGICRYVKPRDANCFCCLKRRSAELSIGFIDVLTRSVLMLNGI